MSSQVSMSYVIPGRAARTGPQRPAAARTTDPPTIDLRPLKVIPRFVFAPATLTVTQLLQFSTLATRTPATPTRN